MKSLSMLLLLVFISYHCLLAQATNDLQKTERNQTDLELTCTSGCLHCKVVAQCVNMEYQYTNCVTEQACDDTPPTPSCKNIAATKCSCDLPDGKYVDPYNPQYYTVCVAGQPNYLNCGSGKMFSHNKNACVNLPPCTDFGCFPIIEECVNYYCCQSDNIGGYKQQVKNCAYNEVFDDINSRCMKLNNPSATLPGVDKRKCDLYQVPNGDSYCCAVGEMYDSSKYSCVPDNGYCADVPICYDQYWETTACKKCTSSSTNYATKTKCSKYYYSCASDGRGSYVPVLQQCPANLIYNPTQNYCDLSTSVSGCY